MKKVIVYGSPMCPHCVEAKEILEKEGIRYGYVDITAGMAHLKKFLALRDSRPEHQIPAGGGAAAAASAHRSRGGPTIQQPQPRTAVRGCDQKELSV